ncbi:hypothetical protein [Acinetobacter populi]|nr:hypothetical protein [Acinetobacter populi]
MIEKDTYVKVLRKKYADFLFGYNNQIYDEHLLGYITKEIGFLVKEDFNIYKIDNFWVLGTSLDWVKKFTKIDEDYLLKIDHWYGYGYYTQLSGVVLSAFSKGVGLALDGEITASYNLDKSELDDIALEIKNMDKRVLFFKSVEDYKKNDESE